jgi:hypothetical protein
MSFVLENKSGNREIILAQRHHSDVYDSSCCSHYKPVVILSTEAPDFAVGLDSDVCNNLNRAHVKSHNDSE